MKDKFEECKHVNTPYIMRTADRECAKCGEIFRGDGFKEAIRIGEARERRNIREWEDVFAVGRQLYEEKLIKNTRAEVVREIRKMIHSCKVQREIPSDIIDGWYMYLDFSKLYEELDKLEGVGKHENKDNERPKRGSK